MLFSVVIPAFNRSDLLAATLRSVLAQSFDDYEVIVVDDASTDNTLEVARSFGPRVTALSQPNAGPGVARNLGLAHARGEYIAFLDSDDLWFPWTLETLRHFISAHNRPSIISGRPVMFTNESELAPVVCGRAECDTYADYLASDPVSVLPGAGLMTARADALRAVGGFTSDRVYCEDADLYMRMGEAPGLVSVRSPATLAYRRHPASAMLNFDKMVAGVRRMVRCERAGLYTGGAARARDRRRHLAHLCRCTALNCLDAGHWKHALRVYTDSVRWNIAAHRWSFVLGLPGLALASATGLRRPPPIMHGVENRPATSPSTAGAA